MARLMVAMSGGVDSSVAAALLQRQGHDCAGVMLRLFDSADAGLAPESGCCSQADAEDAAAVARRLGIPFYVFNFKDAFREDVLAPFARCYAAGRTPNPCVECNRCLKFGRLLDRARTLGYAALATGHYARTEKTPEGYLLKKGADAEKDQSYMLFRLTQEQLAHVRFPLGALKKEQTRALAAAFGLATARKRDSEDLCFAPDGDCAAAVERILGRTFPPGPFLDGGGREVGRHRGIVRYTVGQRRGLGLSAGKRLYVERLVPRENAVVVGDGSALWGRVLEAEYFHWISGRAPEKPLRAAAKLRYRHREAACLVTPLGPDRVRIAFDEPQRAIAPGQAAVVYDGETVLGGGTITDTPEEGTRC